MFWHVKKRYGNTQGCFLRTAKKKGLRGRISLSVYLEPKWLRWLLDLTLRVLRSKLASFCAYFADPETFFLPKWPYFDQNGELKEFRIPIVTVRPDTFLAEMAIFWPKWRLLGPNWPHFGHILTKMDMPKMATSSNSKFQMWRYCTITCWSLWTLSYDNKN